MMYFVNLLLTVVGHVLVTIGTAGHAAFTALITGGNGVLCMRTRNILILGMIATGVTLDVVPAPQTHGAAVLALLRFAFDVLAVAADALPSIGQAPQHCLSDNGASATITSSYHGEIPGSRRPTEVPQGFKQGTGKLTCGTTFIARRDFAGTGYGSVACTEMKWQHAHRRDSV